MGVQPSLHASAVLGLSLIPCDSYFQSGIADLVRGEQMAPGTLFSECYFSPHLLFYPPPLAQTSEEKQLAPSLLGLIVFPEPL